MNPGPAPLQITGILKAGDIRLLSNQSDARCNLSLYGIISRVVIQVRFDVVGRHGIESLSFLEFGDRFDCAGLEQFRPELPEELLRGVEIGAVDLTVDRERIADHFSLSVAAAN